MASNGMEDDGPPLTELESLQLKANAVTDDSLESTRRMIALCEDVSACKELKSATFFSQTSFRFS